MLQIPGCCDARPQQKGRSAHSETWRVHGWGQHCFLVAEGNSELFPFLVGRLANLVETWIGYNLLEDMKMQVMLVVFPTGAFVCALLNHSPTVHTHRLGVLNFRDWFGIQIMECIFKHKVLSTLRVEKIRDWFEDSCFL